MRLLAAFLMAVGMVMLSSWGPEPVWASGCGYYECDSEGDCVWVSQPCPVSAGGTVYSNGSCDDEGPCSSDGGTVQNVPVGCQLEQGCDDD